MCFVCSKCTEIAATKRRRQFFEKIAELRQKRQEYIGMNKIHVIFIITDLKRFFLFVNQLKDKDSG
jgi:hypothetical protein